MVAANTHGKICYLEIPARDAERSAEFYARAFGWVIRARGDGQLAFDDAVGGVSGAWVVGRPPAVEPGMMVYVMVDSVARTLEAIVAAGGEIVQPASESPPVIARFRDPAGNIVGLYQD